MRVTIIKRRKNANQKALYRQFNTILVLIKWHSNVRNEGQYQYEFIAEDIY
jgi:hypothetical protein